MRWRAVVPLKLLEVTMPTTPRVGRSAKKPKVSTMNEKSVGNDMPRKNGFPAKSGVKAKI
jgi:hypothetical protein